MLRLSQMLYEQGKNIILFSLLFEILGTMALFLHFSFSSVAFPFLAVSYVQMCLVKAMGNHYADDAWKRKLNVDLSSH